MNTLRNFLSLTVLLCIPFVIWSQEKTDLDWGKMKQDVKKAIGLFDHDRYAKREHGKLLMQRCITDWIAWAEKNEMYSADFPFLSLLQEGKDPSLEVTVRKEDMLEFYEKQVMTLRWSTKRFCVPQNWQASPPRVSALLNELSQQYGCRFTIHQRHNLAINWSLQGDPVIKDGMDLHGRTFWQVLSSVNKVHPALRIQQYGDHSYHLAQWWGGDGQAYFANDGVIGAILRQERGGSTLWLEYMAEPHLLLEHVKVKRAHMKMPGGSSHSFWATALENEKCTEFRIYPPVPLVKGNIADVHLEAEVTAWTYKVIPVADLKKQQEIKTPFGKLRYIAIKGTSERRADKMLWQVHATHDGPAYAAQLCMGVYRCLAFTDKKATKRARWDGCAVQGSAPFHYMWEFEDEPRAVHLLIPHRAVTKQTMFSFRNVKYR